MIPTMTNCLDAARFYLGDDQTSGGEVFTNTILTPAFNMAYRELFRALQGIANPRVQRTVFYDLPANTAFLAPSTAGIADFGEIEVMEERGGVTSVSITNAVTGSGFVTITAASHGFATGDAIVVFGVVGLSGTSGIWGVTVTDANTFKLNGAVGAGTYTAATGTASKSGETFTEVIGPRRIIDVGPVSSSLGVYDWYEDAFHFQMCNVLRELRITYISSAATIAAVGDTTGVDDSLDFLAIRTAGLAASSRGARDRAAELNAMALGASGQADGSGGILRELVAAGVRALQANPCQRPPFRDRYPFDTSYWM